MSAPLLQLEAVLKDYHALRPLRIERFTLTEGEHITLLGFDAASAEVFVNLVTGAILPDQGTVTLFGKVTREIVDSEQWLPLVDRVGIVSPRAALLESLSALQNIALPLSIDIDPLGERTRDAAAALAREIALPESVWAKPVAELSPGERLRVRTARAVALHPSLVLLEHPFVDVDQSERRSLDPEIGALLKRRGLSSLTLATVGAFRPSIATRVLLLNPTTGALSTERSGWLRPRLR